jgi:hypothetical protein
MNIRYSKLICCLFSLIFVYHILIALEYTVPSIPYGLTSGDIDLDGDIDVLVGCRNNSAQDTICVFLNDGYSNFNPIFLEKEVAHYLYCAKIDDDSYPDLVTKILEDYQIVYYPNEGNASFGDAISIHQTLSDHLEYIKIIDMNNDDFFDIVFCKRGNPGYWGILTNDGFGNFEETVHYNSTANITNFAVSRINEDEYPAIVITTSELGTLVFYYSTNGYIQDDFYPNAYHSPYIFDMNNDELNDISIFQYHEFPASECKLRVFYNEGNNTFSTPDTLFFPGGTLIKDIADYNNDNYPDVAYFRYLYAGPENFIYVSLNDQEGTFTEPVEYYVGHPTFFSATSDDVDSNGFLDLIMTGFLGDDNQYRVKILFNDGTGNFVEEPFVGIYNDKIQSTNFEFSNFPNPFNHETTIDFTIQIDSRIELSIYNIKGQKVKTLVQDEITRGTHSINWNGDDEKGNPVSSGIYYSKLNVNGKTEAVHKCLLLK